MAYSRFGFSFLLLFALVSGGFAQRDQGGFISPGDSLSMLLPSERIIFLPQDGFSLYEVPNGDFKGKILPGPPLDSPANEVLEDSLMTSTITGTSIQTQLLPLEAYFETTQNQFYLSFNQRIDEHVFVLIDSYQGWIAINEIRKKGFELVSWIEFYGESKDRMIYPRDKIAFIRMGPSIDAKIIEIADELYSEISSIGKCEGSFCLANVIKYNNPYDPTKSRKENVQKSYKGWIQIIDDAGKPLVAHHTPGE